MAVIYKIVNLRRDRIYVGHTCDPFKKRIYNHRYALKRNKHENARLQYAWNKYGGDAFRFEMIEECEESQKLLREQFYIDTLKPYYNIAPVAGSRKGVPQPPHVGEAVRKANLARDHKKPEGFGLTMSKAVKGKPRSVAQRAATLRALELGRQKSAANKPGWVPSHRIGAKDSAATIEKRRISRLAFEAGQRDKGIGNWWITDGATEQMIPSTDPIPSGWRRGRQPKIGEIGRSRVGEKRSDAARAKMSAAHLKRDALALDAGS